MDETLQRLRFATKWWEQAENEGNNTPDHRALGLLIRLAEELLAPATPPASEAPLPTTAPTTSDVPTQASHLDAGPGLMTLMIPPSLQPPGVMGPALTHAGQCSECAQAWNALMLRLQIHAPDAIGIPSTFQRQGSKPSGSDLIRESEPSRSSDWMTESLPRGQEIEDVASHVAECSACLHLLETV